MALSAGSQHMNLLAPATGAAANGSGAKAVPAVNLAATGSTASLLALNAGSSAAFAAGCMVAVDADYANGIGRLTYRFRKQIAECVGILLLRDVSRNRHEP